MYAVIQTGGKQYRVTPGDFVQVEKLPGKVGAAIKFDQVLFVSGKDGTVIGKPTIAKATVAGEVVGQGRGKKIIVGKFKRRKDYQREQGHRQYYTDVLITELDAGTGKKASLAAADKRTKLAKFHTQLRPKGQAFTPRTLGSRTRALGGPQSEAIKKKKTKSTKRKAKIKAKAKAKPKKKSKATAKRKRKAKPKKKR